MTSNVPISKKFFFEYDIPSVPGNHMYARTALAQYPHLNGQACEFLIGLDAEETPINQLEEERMRTQLAWERMKNGTKGGFIGGSFGFVLGMLATAIIVPEILVVGAFLGFGLGGAVGVNYVNKTLDGINQAEDAIDIPRIRVLRLEHKVHVISEKILRLTEEERNTQEQLEISKRFFQKIASDYRNARQSILGQLDIMERRW